MNRFSDVRRQRESGRDAQAEKALKEEQYRKYLLRIGFDTTGSELSRFLLADDVAVAREFLEEIATVSPSPRRNVKFQRGVTGEKSFWRLQRSGRIHHIGHIRLPHDVSRVSGNFDLYLCSDGLLRMGRKAGPFKMEHSSLVGSIPDGAEFVHFSRYSAADFGNSYWSEPLENVLRCYL